jgi:hypothetical protein
MPARSLRDLTMISARTECPGYEEYIRIERERKAEEKAWERDQFNASLADKKDYWGVGQLERADWRELARYKLDITRDFKRRIKRRVQKYNEELEMFRRLRELRLDQRGLRFERR